MDSYLVRPNSCVQHAIQEHTCTQQVWTATGVSKPQDRTPRVLRAMLPQQSASNNKHPYDPHSTTASASASATDMTLSERHNTASWGSLLHYLPATRAVTACCCMNSCWCSCHAIEQKLLLPWHYYGQIAANRAMQSKQIRQHAVACMQCACCVCQDACMCMCTAVKHKK